MEKNEDLMMQSIACEIQSMKCPHKVDVSDSVMQRINELSVSDDKTMPRVKRFFYYASGVAACLAVAVISVVHFQADTYDTEKITQMVASTYDYQSVDREYMLDNTAANMGGRLEGFFSGIDTMDDEE